MMKNKVFNLFKILNFQSILLHHMYKMYQGLRQTRRALMVWFKARDNFRYDQAATKKDFLMLKMGVSDPKNNDLASR